MANFEQLLTLTSRTFGLSIPLLDQPHRDRLTLAYLLFRVADTMEDAEERPRAERVAALQNLASVLRSNDLKLSDGLSEQWVTWQPSQHPGYLQLLQELPALLSSIRELGSPAREIIVRSACRTVDGMLEFIDRGEADGSLRLQTLDELRKYCYVVAGIVGEMITELFVTDIAALRPVAQQLRQSSAAFGEGLQLVNILRDAADDAKHGRIYLPPGVDRADLFALARDDLQKATEYWETLRNCSPGAGVVPFIELPLRLANATLDLVESEGAGAKLSRRQVAELLQKVDARFADAEALPASLRNHLEQA